MSMEMRFTLNEQELVLSLPEIHQLLEAMQYAVKADKQGTPRQFGRFRVVPVNSVQKVQIRT